MEGLTSTEIIHTVGKNQGCYIESFDPQPKEGDIQETLDWNDAKQKYISATPKKITRTFTTQ